MKTSLSKIKAVKKTRKEAKVAIKEIRKWTNVRAGEIDREVGKQTQLLLNCENELIRLYEQLLVDTKNAIAKTRHDKSLINV